MLGYWAIGRVARATPPISTMTIASTLARTGRLMKNAEIMGIRAGYLVGAAGGAAAGGAAGGVAGVAAGVAAAGIAAAGGVAMVVSLGTTFPPGTALPLVVSTTRSSALRPVEITRRLPTSSWPIVMRRCSTTSSLLTTSTYLPAWSSAMTRSGMISEAAAAT